MPLFNWFTHKLTSCLGIDIGTAVLKIVELKKDKERLKLVNYSMAQPYLPENEKSFRTTDLSVQELANLIKRILEEAKIKTKKAVISLPIFSSFSVLISLPKMDDKELSAAIPFEVKKYIPISMDEVMLDWSIVEKAQEEKQPVDLEIKKPQTPEKVQVLVVAVPKEIINKYVQVAKMAGLELLTLEQETFSLSRALIGNDPNIYLIIDIGTRGSSIIIVDNGFVTLSHSLEKLEPDLICKEIRKVVDIYKMRYNRRVKNCILVGGLQESNLDEFLPNCLIEMETIIGKPFSRIDYLPKLEPILKEIGPTLAVVVGLAMREL